MKNAYKKKVLILALYAGEIMMKSGAEVARVEDTIVRICKACRVDYAECFATTTGITLALDSSDPASDMHTFIKRINYTDINLTKISKVNQFSRRFTSTDLSVEDGFDQLRDIAKIRMYNIFLRIFAAVLVGIGMTPYYGGNIGDMLNAGIASGAAYALASAITILEFPKFLRIFVSSMAAALIVIALSWIGYGADANAGIVGAVTIFMPGIAITNSARDMLSGDMQSGVSRFAEALIIGIAIAGGTGFMVKLWQMTGRYVPRAADEIPYSIPWFILFGFVMTLGFCILFRTPPGQIMVTSIIGMVGMLILCILTDMGYGNIASNFIGSAVVAALAEVASRAGKDATTIFILPAIIPFVPGLSLFTMMEAALASDMNKAIDLGTQSMLIAGTIAVALILVAALTRLGAAVIRRISARLRRRRTGMSSEKVIKVRYEVGKDLEDAAAAYGREVSDYYEKLKAEHIPYTGWMSYAETLTDGDLCKIEAMAAEIREKSDVFVVIGIGGSYLGAKAALDLIDGGKKAEREKDAPVIEFAGFNLSATYHKELLSRIKDKDITICQISKSGSTAEPSAAFELLRSLLIEKYGVEQADVRTYAVTDPDSGILRRIADEKKWKTLSIPADIGGRYSVLTPVGLLPIAVAGADIREVVRGAVAALDPVHVDGAKKLARVRRSIQDAGKKAEVIAAFEPSANSFVDWTLQLFGESEGKAGKGMLPVGAIFSRDLHSLGQFFQEGSQIFCEMLLNVETPSADIEFGETENYLSGRTMRQLNNAVMEGVIKAHRSIGIPVTIIDIPDTTEYSFGLLVQFMETTCALTGLLMGINPFNQPGVEAYKKEMKKVLEDGLQ